MVVDIERMNAMIEQVLDYARCELEPASMQTLDMAAPLAECIPSARLRGVDIHSGLAGPLPWHGDALMQPFQRHEGLRNRATGGTGLGFAVVQGAVRQRGGQLSLLDRPGSRLIVRLELPAIAAT